MNNMLKKILMLSPEVRRILDERAELARLRPTQVFPPGHFYSPFPDLEELRENEEEIFNIPESIPSVNLNEESQLRLLASFADYYKELPFKDEKTEGFRYYFINDKYGYSDAIYLYCMLRHVKPNRIIEVGSGYSSCVTLDTNEHFLGNSLTCTFIEPYPELLESLLKDEERDKVQIIQRKLQEVSLDTFDSLEENDILFIDSTHVSKVHSDVNYIFFDILPRLKKGVYIHFHDIFFPFEYPKEWIYQGRAWTEDYLMRAFLQYNEAFEIILFGSYLGIFHAKEVGEVLPLCLKNSGGSLWLRKIK